MQILHGKKWHAKEHVHFFATRKIVRVSNLDHQAVQRWQEQEAGHAGSFTRMEAGNYFLEQCLQNTSAKFLCGTCFRGDCVKDKSNDECVANT